MKTSRPALETLSCSGMAAAQMCLRSYDLRYRRHLVPLEPARWLVFGGVARSWLEAWHRTRDQTAAQAVIDAAFAHRHTSAAAKHDWHVQSAMLRAYVAQYATDDFDEVLGLGVGFAAPLVNPSTGRQSRSFTMHGRADGVVRRGERVLLLKHRTMSTVPDDLAERAAFDSMLALHAHFAMVARGFPVTGILLDVLAKPRLVQRTEAVSDDSARGAAAAKGKKTAEDDEAFGSRLDFWFSNEPRLTRIELPLDADAVTAAREQLWAVSKILLAARRAATWPPTTKACHTFAGTCPYWPICCASRAASSAVVDSQFRVESNDRATADDAGSDDTSASL